MKELELDFILKNKNVNELEDYARRNKLTGYSSLRKQKLIELVNSDRKEKAKNLLSTLQKDIFLEIVNLYNNGKNYENILGSLVIFWLKKTVDKIFEPSLINFHKEFSLN